MAAYSGCGEGDGGIGHGKRRSRTGLARVGGDVGSVADGRRQAGSGMARSRARARLNWVSQGQRCGRCWVSRPARAKTRRLRVLVVTIRSPRPMRAVQRARLWPSPVPPARRRWRRSGPRGDGSARRRTSGPDGITAEEIFAYTYAVLHDPAYRHEYAVDLLREFPRLPLYPDFHHWAEMGQKLLDLHIGFESAEPYPLERHDRNEVNPKRAILRADKEKGIITLDERTTLAGIPAQAWEYRLGSRSALEWVLDQYRERKPRDPTIRERFNTYRFSDHKERVIDLLGRLCRVSVETMEIVDSMTHWEEGKMVVHSDRNNATMTQTQP